MKLKFIKVNNTLINLTEVAAVKRFDNKIEFEMKNQCTWKVPCDSKIKADKEFRAITAIFSGAGLMI